MHWVCLLHGAACGCCRGSFGWGSSFASVYVFFSQMAVVTFGGVYAVLAYVAQEAVVTFGWLQPGEMIDGLALAETTPGPLVLVLTFVGFLAAYRDSFGLDPLLAGVLGAILTTWATFVPCFLWIFLGAPYIERLRNNKAVSGALAAITAAVGGHPQPGHLVWHACRVQRSGTQYPGAAQHGAARIDWVALSLCFLAGVLVFRTKLGMLWTLAVFGVLGVAVGLLP